MKFKFVAKIKYESDTFYKVDELGWDANGLFKWVKIGDRLIVPERLEIYQLNSVDENGQETYKNISDDSLVVPYPLLHVDTTNKNFVPKTA